MTDDLSSLGIGAPSEAYERGNRGPNGRYPDYRAADYRPYTDDLEDRYPSERYVDRSGGYEPEHQLSTEGLAALGIAAGIGLLLGSVFAASATRSRTDRRAERPARSRRARSVERDETTDLIASSKVEGTAVYDRDGNKLGEVLNFMVGKRSGRVAYAVLSFGGMMGIGTSHYPLPWSSLDYDTSKGGYVVDITKDQLRSAPSHGPDEDPFADPRYGRRVSNYWLETTAY
jgi:hypothetical protein